MKIKMLFRSLLLAAFLCATIGPVTTANAAPEPGPEAPIMAPLAPVLMGLPCNTDVVKGVEAFKQALTSALESNPMAKGLIIGTKLLYIVVPGAAEAQASFLYMAQTSGMNVNSIAELEAWLSHTGFTRGTANNMGDVAWRRSTTWDPGSNMDNCGPMPPGMTASKTEEERRPREGYDWSKNVELALPALALATVIVIIMIAVISRRRRQVFVNA